MDFDLNEDQEMLKAVAERFVNDRYDMDRRRKYLAYDSGFCAENWTCLGELGLIGAPFSVESGGMGAGRADLAVLFEALGRGCVVEPLVESAVLAGGLFERSAGLALRTAWIASLVSGDRRIVLAHREARMRWKGDPLRARQDSNGIWRLNGDRPFLPAGRGADAYIVSAVTADGATEFFLVPADSTGLTITPFRLIDGGVGVSLTLRDVDVSDDHHLPAAADALGDAQARATIASAAEMIGLMEMMFAETLEYLRTRQQFGVSLGSFQALQHRMVAQYAALEQARALLDLAVVTDADDVPASDIAIAGMRAYIAEMSATFGHEMVQLHGAMGVTDELIIGQAHKRLIFLSRYPEGAVEALDRYAA